MTELQQALDQISVIRTQLARGTQFRGYGPRSIAATGVLALVVAWGQAWWYHGRPVDPDDFLLTWVATAVISAGVSGWETVIRTKKMHYGFSRQMIQAAVEQFVPSVAAGLLLTVVLAKGAPGEVWMLPGLWQIAFSLGVFASRQFLPRAIFVVGLWYLVCGLACLALFAGSRDLSAWTMGVPFGVGQALLAAVLLYGYEDPVEISDS